MIDLKIMFMIFHLNLIQITQVVLIEMMRVVRAENLGVGPALFSSRKRRRRSVRIEMGGVG